MIPAFVRRLAPAFECSKVFSPCTLRWTAVDPARHSGLSSAVNKSRDDARRRVSRDGHVTLKRNWVGSDDSLRSLRSRMRCDGV